MTTENARELLELSDALARALIYIDGAYDLLGPIMADDPRLRDSGMSAAGMLAVAAATVRGVGELPRLCAAMAEARRVEESR